MKVIADAFLRVRQNTIIIRIWDFSEVKFAIYSLVRIYLLEELLEICKGSEDRFHRQTILQKLLKQDCVKITVGSA